MAADTINGFLRHHVRNVLGSSIISVELFTALEDVDFFSDGLFDP
jgi:hypothetical protein